MPRKRTTKLTPELIKEAARLVAEGNYITHVAQALGISRKTFYNWLEQGARATRGLKREFYEAITKAEAEAVLRNVKIIQKAAETNWQAAAWWLERKYPEEWGRKDRMNLETDNGIVIKVEKVEETSEVQSNELER